MPSSIFDIASKMEEALKDNKTRLYEGDQPDDDQDDKNNDENNADTGTTDGGDVGGGDLGGGDIGGGEGGGAENPSSEDTEEEIDQMQSNVDAEQNVPKDLVLNDGTTTNTSVDSTTQAEPLDQDKKDFLFQFGEGNFDEFSESAKEYSQSVTSVIHTFVPLCEKALIELFGSSNRYKRDMFNAQTKMDNETTSIDVNLRYNANNWIGTDIPYAAIQSDRQHIINTISVVPGITIKQVNIDSNTGNLDISVNIGGIKENQQDPATAQLQQQVVNESMEDRFKRICENIDNLKRAELETYEKNWGTIEETLNKNGITNEEDQLFLKTWIWESYSNVLDDGDEIAFLSRVQEKIERCGYKNSENIADRIYEQLEKYEDLS